MAEDDGITQRVLNQIGEWLASVMREVGQRMADVLNPIIETMEGWLDTVFTKLSNVVNAISDVVADIWNGIRASIQEMLGNAFDFMKDLYDSIASRITSAFDVMTDNVIAIYDVVIDKITNIGDTMKTWVVDAFDFVKDKIGVLVDTVVTYVQELFDDVKVAIGDIIDSAQRVVTSVIDGIELFIDEVIGDIGGSLRDLLETIAEIPEDLAAFAALIKSSIEDFIGGPLGEIPDSIMESMKNMFADATLEEAADTKRLLLDTVYSSNSPPKTREEAIEFYNASPYRNGLSNWIFQFLLGIFGVMGNIGSLTAGHNELLVQESFYNAPGKMLPPGDQINAIHRGLHTQDVAVEKLRYFGYDKETSLNLVHLSETLPGEGDLLSWYLRGFIDEAELDKKLSQRAWSQESIITLKKSAFFVPPVQDLITMAVREAFTPDIAEAFGQYEGFPEKFAEHAKKHGVSEDWAKAYWASHWALPSVQMGFEMLHRGEIDDATMNMLLKAADVMPFWRDKLIAIAYNPFTRVDIRRMHKTGVLSEEEVFIAYKEIGYNESKAEKLTAFTLAINEDEPEDDPLEINQLTRGSIINFYRDGIIERDLAFEFLVGLGNTESAAELYLKAADMDEELQTRKELTDLILLRYNNDILTFEEAEDELAGLGLETRELQKASLKLVRERERNIKMPSRSDLDKFLLAGIINDTRYKQMVQLHGYSEEWAGNYLQLLRSKESAG